MGSWWCLHWCCQIVYTLQVLRTTTITKVTTAKETKTKKKRIFEENSTPIQPNYGNDVETSSLKENKKLLQRTKNVYKEEKSFQNN